MCLHVHACMFMSVYGCLHLCTRVCVYTSVFVSTHMYVPQMYGRMCSIHEEAEGGVSGPVSAFQMAPDVTFHPPPWLLRSLHPETRELSFRTKWASPPGEGRKLLPKANRIVVMLGSLEPAGPCLILKECVPVPTQWSRPQPDQEPGALGQQQLPLEQGAWLAGDRQSCKPVWLE